MIDPMPTTTVVDSRVTSTITHKDRKDGPTMPDQAQYMLTTVDNPFDPFTQWDDWYAFDHNAGYHTPGMLARITLSSDELSEADQDLAIEQAIDEIVRENVLGIYRKVSQTSKNSVESGT